MGCGACLSADGSLIEKVGPIWKGLAGGKVPLVRKLETAADDAYLGESTREPAAKIVRGYEKSDTAMPSYEGVISDSQIDLLVVYSKSLK